MWFSPWFWCETQCEYYNIFLPLRYYCMLFEPYVNMFSMKLKQIYIKRHIFYLNCYFINAQYISYFFYHLKDIILIISCHSTSHSTTDIFISLYAVSVRSCFSVINICFTCWISSYALAVNTSNCTKCNFFCFSWS